MTELKTLKDFSGLAIAQETMKIRFSEEAKKVIVGETYVQIKVLREEAMNHILTLLLREFGVRRIKETSGLSKEDEFDNLKESIEIEAKINWIKHFFNITEEELK